MQLPEPFKNSNGDDPPDVDCDQLKQDYHDDLVNWERLKSILPNLTGSARTEAENELKELQTKLSQLGSTYKKYCGPGSINPFELTLLIVLDGRSSFYPNAQDTTDQCFSLSHIVDVFRWWSTPVAQIRLRLAHRQMDANPIDSHLPFDANYASESNFVFSEASLHGVHEVWLIGYSAGDYFFPSTPEDPTDLTLCPELQALCQFMQNGGGVFATGDHEDLGNALCGYVPRVRSMRKWFFKPGENGYSDSKAYGANWLNRVPVGPLKEPCAPPSCGYYRLDTLQKGRTWTEVCDPEDETKKIPIYDFDNQSDDIPQRLIFPADPPHFLFQGKNGVCDVFPDHMHEGEIIRPQDYGLVSEASPGGAHYHWKKGDIVSGFDEYPVNPISGVRPLPEIVAFGSVVRQDHN